MQGSCDVAEDNLARQGIPVTKCQIEARAQRAAVGLAGVLVPLHPRAVASPAGGRAVCDTAAVE